MFVLRPIRPNCFWNTHLIQVLEIFSAMFESSSLQSYMFSLDNVLTVDCNLYHLKLELKVYDPYVHDTCSSCGVYPNLHLPYCDFGGICFHVMFTILGKCMHNNTLFSLISESYGHLELKEPTVY